MFVRVKRSAAQDLYAGWRGRIWVSRQRPRLGFRAGHPEGYLEGFANVYRAAYDAMIARGGGKNRWRRRTRPIPNVNDGLEGMLFIQQCVASSKQKRGPWLPLSHKRGAQVACLEIFVRPRSQAPAWERARVEALLPVKRSGASRTSVPKRSLGTRRSKSTTMPLCVSATSRLCVFRLEGRRPLKFGRCLYGHGFFGRAAR